MDVKLQLTAHRHPGILPCVLAVLLSMCAVLVVLRQVPPRRQLRRDLFNHIVWQLGHNLQEGTGGSALQFVFPADMSELLSWGVS